MEGLFSRNFFNRPRFPTSHVFRRKKTLSMKRFDLSCQGVKSYFWESTLCLVGFVTFISSESFRSLSPFKAPAFTASSLPFFMSSSFYLWINQEILPLPFLSPPSSPLASLTYLYVVVVHPRVRERKQEAKSTHEKEFLVLHNLCLFLLLLLRPD